MSTVIPAPEAPSLPVSGTSDRFPIRRIYCVGRNYADHVREMGSDLREPPFFFGKPADTISPDGTQLPYPRGTSNLHHEAELVVAIGLGGTDIPEDTALAYIYGYATGNDLTLRDQQEKAKEGRRPWDMAKGFDGSAVVGMIHPVAEVGHPGADATMTLAVNGNIRQSTVIGNMIWPVAGIVAQLSQMVALAPGDLIFTGTPAGVGPLSPGDICTVEIAGLSPVTVQIV